MIVKSIVPAILLVAVALGSAATAQDTSHEEQLPIPSPDQPELNSGLGASLPTYMSGNLGTSYLFEQYPCGYLWSDYCYPQGQCGCHAGSPGCSLGHQHCTRSR